jgi:CheY-like chemotaxis protein
MSSDNGLNNPPPADTIVNTTAKSLTTTGANNKRILIVDDEEDIAWCFKIALECAGFIVDIFNDPMKSLSVYKAGVYDLLLLDIRMPRMSGFELYDKIKEIDNEVNVFFTAFEEYYEVRELDQNVVHIFLRVKSPQSGIDLLISLRFRSMIWLV